MNCTNYQEQIPDWLNKNQTESERIAFENHVAQCGECKKALNATQQVWNLLGEIPSPESSPALRVKFNAMLETYKAGEADKRQPISDLFSKLKNLWTLQPRLQLAYDVGLLVVGLALGYFSNRQNNTQIETLSTQVTEMKQMMMLSLLENPSASERLRAVSYTDDFKDVDTKVVEALLTTLNNDPNINVRLMTIEALTKLANNPIVREGLVQSIIKQDSPLVQSALADAMVKLQEKRSVKSFQQLLKKNNLNELVKTKIEQTIKKLS